MAVIRKLGWLGLILADWLVVWFAATSLFIFYSIWRYGFFKAVEKNRKILVTETVLAACIMVFGIQQLIWNTLKLRNTKGKEQTK